MSNNDNIDNSIFSSEPNPYPEFINFNSTQAVMLYGSASFIRNPNDSNILITTILGPNVAPTIWYSPYFYLPSGTFNYIQNSDVNMFINQKDVEILENVTLRHDILIQYKITKFDGSNFFNSRNIRCTLVNSTGDVYNVNIEANNQPDTGQHDFLLMSGVITHKTNDIVRLRFYIAQDNLHTDQSDTLITIMRISWNISGLVNRAF